MRRDGPALLLLGGDVLADPEALDDADRLAQATGAALLTETSYARLETGSGRVAIDSVPYPVDGALDRSRSFRHCILIGAEEPVAFFASPGRPGRLLPEDCSIEVLARPNENAGDALGRLVSVLGAERFSPRHERHGDPCKLLSGRLTAAGTGAALANRLPRNAIVCDEALTNGGPIFAAMRPANPYSRLKLTGGAIGIGLPMAIGAAIACPDRKVIVLQADGSGMYTPQALWTHARERLDILSIVLSNRSYAILRHEFSNFGIAISGHSAMEMTSLDNPPIDWTSIAEGMGVSAGRASTVEAFDALLGRALTEEGPFLIEADLGEPK